MFLSHNLYIGKLCKLPVLQSDTDDTFSNTACSSNCRRDKLRYWYWIQVCRRDSLVENHHSSGGDYQRSSKKLSIQFQNYFCSPLDFLPLLVQKHIIKKYRRQIHLSRIVTLEHQESLLHPRQEYCPSWSTFRCCMLGLWLDSSSSQWNDGFMKLSPHLFCARMTHHLSLWDEVTALQSQKLWLSTMWTKVLQLLEISAHKFELLKSHNTLSPIHQRKRKELSLTLGMCKDGKE